MKVYPLGYAARDAQKQLDLLMETGNNAVLVDIRYSPYSSRPLWRRDGNQGLEKRYGDQLYGGRYRFLGRELGNTAYKSKGTIHLANPVYGIAAIEVLLEMGHDVILLCACKEYATCHRKAVVDLLVAELPEVEVVL